MFKKIIASLFFFAFMAQTFSKAVIVLSFYINQNYIAKNLCENRNKPKSCCAGKCQLTKQLNKDTNNEKQSSERKASKESEVLSSKSFASILPAPIEYEIINQYHIHPNEKEVTQPTTFFHPPDC